VTLSGSLSAAHDLVKAEAEQAGNHLVLGHLLAVALRPRVGGERMLSLIG